MNRTMQPAVTLLRNWTPWPRRPCACVSRLRSRLAAGAAVGSRSHRPGLRFGSPHDLLWRRAADPRYSRVASSRTLPLPGALGWSQGSRTVRGAGYGGGLAGLRRNRRAYGRRLDTLGYLRQSCRKIHARDNRRQLWPATRASSIRPCAPAHRPFSPRLHPGDTGIRSGMVAWSYFLGLPDRRRADRLRPGNPLPCLSTCGGMVRSGNGEPLHLARVVAYGRLQADGPRRMDGILHLLDNRRSRLACCAAAGRIDRIPTHTTTRATSDDCQHFGRRPSSVRIGSEIIDSPN
jgi:hypothetical protein